MDVPEVVRNYTAHLFSMQAKCYLGEVAETRVRTTMPQQLLCGVRAAGWQKVRCRVGREVSHPGPSPDPDKEISTIRLFRRCDSWLYTPDPDRDPWVGKRSLAEEIREPLPRETLALAATTQPLVPRPLRRCDEPQQTPKVAADAEGVEVASQPSTERGVWGLNRLMPMASTPGVNGLLGPAQARPSRLAPHPPVTCAGTPPIERKPQKVKGGRTLPALWRGWRTPKGHQPCLLRMRGQSEASQPFLTH